MADYDIQRTLWTDPATDVGMFNQAARCWELSAQTSAVVEQRIGHYTARIEDVSGEIDEVQQRIDQLPIDSPERQALLFLKEQLQRERTALLKKKNNLSAADYMWKGWVDKRDVVALLENSVVRIALMYNNPQNIRRDPQYNTTSGQIPLLSANPDVEVERWCAEQDQDGNWIAKKKNIHPLSTTLSTVTSQIPLLSTSILPDPYDRFFQQADATPYLETTVTQIFIPDIRQLFYAKNAVCALTLPASLNLQAIVPTPTGNDVSSYRIDLLPYTNWTDDTSIWLDHEKAFNGSISDLTAINNFDILETAGWGGNGRWISGLVTIPDSSTSAVVKTGETIQKARAEWYCPRSRYLGYYGLPTSPTNLPVSFFYFDVDFFLSSFPIVSSWFTLGEYDYETGDPISSFWGMYRPETPSIWPTTNNLKAKPVDSEDIYSSYWNLANSDTLARFTPYRQDQVYWQITGNAYISSGGGRYQDYVPLSANLSSIPNYEWMRKVNDEGLDWRNFKTEFFDPYTDFTRKSNDQNWPVIEGCRFRGSAVGDWPNLSGHYNAATVWYWNDMFNRYGEVLGVWYIVPIVGYSARWREWYDTVSLQTLVNFDHLDVKVTIMAVRADTAQDQTTKSWRAYMGNAFWYRINQIDWEDRLPPAPPDPEFPTPQAQAVNVYNSSLRRCKCLGPTMAVVKYKWRGKNDDDGVHYIPLDMPAPEYTWQKPWENTEDGNGS